MAWAGIVAVVVPSPATSEVFDATSRTIWAPMFSSGSFNSISFATVTPSLVMVGEGELGEGLAQVPGEVGGEHADQHVAADSFVEVVVDGPQARVVGLGDAEVPPGVF